MEQTVIQDPSSSHVVSSSDSEKQISLNNFEDIEKEALAYVKQKFGARFHIVQEILRTEEKYNDNLRILQERYADQLNPEKFPKSPISVSTFRSVFDTLYALNTVSNAVCTWIFLLHCLVFFFLFSCLVWFYFIFSVFIGRSSIAL